MKQLGENIGRRVLGQKILKDVSRSFYLSMRLLPAAMREPISLGYLLARASDTMADTEELGAQLRFDVLTGFSEILQGANMEPWLAQLQRDVIPKQKHEGEKVLLENIEAVLAWLSTVPDNQQQAIHQVMSHILRGQKLDIERFELQDGFHFTADEELEEYCYLVAGCVGEFWTEVGLMTVDQFSDIDAVKLKTLGVNYGKALQLINILRDFPSDLKQGRCYIPSVEIEDTKALMTEAARWRQKARSYLLDGETYAASLRVKRARISTALPGMIGTRTLDLLDNADWVTLQGGVKVTRSEVYNCLWRAMFV